MLTHREQLTEAEKVKANSVMAEEINRLRRVVRRLQIEKEELEKTLEVAQDAQIKALELIWQLQNK